MSHRQRRSFALAVLGLGLVLAGGACSDDDPGVTAERSDASGEEASGTTAVDTDAGTPGRPEAPLDPSGFGANLPAVLEQLGFPAAFPLPESYEPADVVGIRVDQSVAFDDPEVEYEVAITQPAPVDEEAFFAEWMDRFDEEVGAGGEVGRGTSDNGTLESVFRSAGFPGDESGSWDIWITRPVGATSGDVTIGITASFHEATFVPIELPAGAAPELPDLSACVTTNGDVAYRAYDDVTNFADDHGYRVTIDLICPGTTMIDTTAAWVNGLEAAGAEGEVNVGDGFANVSNYIGSDGLTYGFDALLADDGSGDTFVHVRIERPV